MMSIAYLINNFSIKNKHLCLCIITLLFLPSIAVASAYLESDIYFGLSKNNGTYISDENFNSFKNKFIVPKFKNGFTVVNAQGSWLIPNGKVENEPTKIVVIMYKNTQSNNLLIKEISEKYKISFKQNSVLVITKNVTPVFY